MDAQDSLMGSFFESCPQLLFIAGLEGQVRIASRALRAVFGAGGEVGSALVDLMHPDDRGMFEAAWARLQQDPAPMRVDLRVGDGNGEYRYVSCHAARSAEGSAVHGGFDPCAFSHPDAVKTLIVDAMVEYVPTIVWAVDRNGTFVYHDGKLIEALGMKRGAHVGKNVLDLYQGVDGRTEEHVARALAGEVVHYFGESHDRHWDNWLIPLHDFNGDQVVLGFTSDMTRARNAEDELRSRLARIEQQQEIIRQLSTPIIEVWDGVLTLPMFGILDSMRTSEVMDNLLDRITTNSSRFAILDMTGVEVVDTGVAGYLIQLVNAIRLLGAEGIVAGIRPTVAQTMITLGADLSQITTHRNLRAALGYCIRAMSKERAAST